MEVKMVDDYSKKWMLATFILAILFITGISCSAKPTEPGFAEDVQYQGERVVETNGLRITLPQEIKLWCGYREEIPLKIKNKSIQNKDVAIRVKTEVNIFINGLTCNLGSEDIPIEVAKIRLPRLQTREEKLKIQSLRVGRYNLKVVIDNKEISLVVDSQLKERGAYFMYRCWFEGAEFFNTVWSNGKKEIGPGERRMEERALVREGLGRGKNREEAEREARRKIWEKYKSIFAKKRPDWKTAYERKKNQHTEIYGFQYVDIDGLGWSEVERQKGQYNWTLGDFMLDLSNKYFYGEPFVRIEIEPEWTKYEKGPSGRWGFYDPQNESLMSHWENYCEALAERYDGDGKDDAPGSPIIKHFILNNEPTQFWFSVDFDQDGWAVPSGEEGLSPTHWFKKAFESGGMEKVGRVYINMFGELVFQMTKRAAEAIHRANPQARVCAHQFIPAQDNSPNAYLFNYLLDRGIGKYIDAWGQHPGNAFNLLTLWEKNPAASYVVEDAANQSPPLESDDLTQTIGALDRKGEVLRTARPVEEIKQENPYMGKLWRKLIDEPYSWPLEDLAELFSKYNLDIPIWVTEEIMIGPLATNRRENLIAALREYSIVFHLKVEITTLASVITEGTTSGATKVSYLPDPIAKGLIIDIGKAIGGSIPVEKFDCRWFVPGENKNLDYRWTVYKLFNRGDEDIIALWSNSGKDEVMEFDINPEANIREVRLVEYDADEEKFRKERELEKIPQEIKIKPLKEFYFLSVKSDQPRFGWLKDIRRRMTDEERELIFLYDDTKALMREAKETLRSQRRRESVEKFRRVSRALNQAEDALIMGHYSNAKEILERIQRFLLDFK